MKVSLVIYAIVVAVLVNTVFAGPEITGTDAVFEMGLESVNIPTPVASLTELVVHNATAVWTQAFSSVRLQTKPSPVKRVFVHNADAVFAADLIAPALTAEGSPSPQPSPVKGEGAEEMATLPADIELEIPETSMNNPDGIAVVIGNRDYISTSVPKVDYAIRDATAMKNFLIKTLGFKEGNILFVENATQAQFNSLFGTEKEHRGRLFDLVKPGKSDVFIYYSGHGAPDPESDQGYFVPVDCDPRRVKLNGYSLNLFYQNISQIPANSFTIVIDACFSGISHGGSLLGAISPIVPTIENPMMLLTDATIMTAARGDEVSGWYPEKRHGLFTYFFLKGISGDADVDENGETTVTELKNFLTDETEGVPYWARRLHSKEQHPDVFGEEGKVIVKY